MDTVGSSQRLDRMRRRAWGAVLNAVAAVALSVVLTVALRLDVLTGAVPAVLNMVAAMVSGACVAMAGYTVFLYRRERR